jgi:CBS domain-containing protein
MEQHMGEKMNAGEVCNRVVTVATRKMTVTQAAQRMREQHVGCLVVVDEAGAGRVIAGILTDRDIVTSVVAKGMDPAKLTLEDVMTAEVVMAQEQDSMADLLALMRRKGVRRIPVATPNGVLLGLVTLDDLLEILAEQLRTVVMAIESEQMRERRLRD